MDADGSPDEVLVVDFPMAVSDGEVARVERLLSAEERGRADRFHRAEDRRRFVLRRGRLREILAGLVGRPPETLRFDVDAGGKPALRDAGAAPLHFSLSRSEGVGLVAVSRHREVGVDVEAIRPFPSAVSVAERFFAPSEARQVAARAGGDVGAAFFDYWTRKEAVVKCSGGGLAQGLDSFVLGPPERAGEECVRIGGWSCRLTRLPPPAAGHVAALAVGGDALHVRRVSWGG